VVGFGVGKLVIVKVNLLMFHPPPMALMPNAIGPAFRVTVCETVCQICQPPVFGMLTVPYTCVPPAFSSCKLPPPLLPLATRYSTLYVPVLGIVTSGYDIQSPVSI